MMALTLNTETCPSRVMSRASVKITNNGVRFCRLATKLLHLKKGDKISFDYDGKSLWLRIDPGKGMAITSADANGALRIGRITLRQRLIDLFGDERMKWAIGELREGRWLMTPVSTKK